MHTSAATWDYINDTLVPGLSYDGTRLILDRANVLVGAARIRQLRAVPGKSGKLQFH